jgi:hypothetical protein
LRLGWSHAVTAPVALAVTTLMAAVFGLIALRASGLGFLMLTLAHSQVLWGTAYRWVSVTEGDNGLRGYPLRYRTGQGRWLFTVEERAFTDWYPFRLFSVGAAVFFDMGAVSGSSLVQAPPPAQPPRRVLRDIGFGLRLGNMRSALGNVVHIDVAHPLDGDPSISRVQLIIVAQRTF